MDLKSKRQSGFIPGLEGLAAVAGLLISVVLLSLNSARAKSRNAKRLADVRQMASALELYFNDKTKYPDTLKELTPVYLGIIPSATLPPDGTCAPEENNYAYHKISTEKYELTFCLGAATSGYREGVRML